MKVICIDNKGCENILTIGKEYDVFESSLSIYYWSEKSYKLVNDCDFIVYLPRRYFITLEELRNKKLEEIGI